LKKSAGSVWFWFYKPKTKKTESNPSQTGQNRVKPKKTDPNQFEPVFVLKNRTKTGWFEPVSVRFRFLKKIFDFVIFFL
jgi:hypothetical protein